MRGWLILRAHARAHSRNVCVCVCVSNALSALHHIWKRLPSSPLDWPRAVHACRFSRTAAAPALTRRATPAAAAVQLAHPPSPPSHGLAPPPLLPAPQLLHALYALHALPRGAPAPPAGHAAAGVERATPRLERRGETSGRRPHPPPTAAQWHRVPVHPRTVRPQAVHSLHQTRLRLQAR